MIWATRSRSQVASGPAGGSRTLSSVRWSARAGPNSPITERASSDRSTGSWWNSSEPASSRERSSRSTESFWRRATCSLIVSRNSARVASSSSSSWSSSTNPPREKIGVRSSWEAVAMNSLRATSTWRSCSCISLKVLVSWPSSSRESTGRGSMNRPWAISPAATSRRRTRRASASATRYPPISASTRAARVAMQEPLADEGHGLGHVVKVAGVHGHPRRVALVHQRLGHHAELLLAEAAEAAVAVLAQHGAAGQGVVPREGGLRLGGVGERVEAKLPATALWAREGLVPVQQRHPGVGGVGHPPHAPIDLAAPGARPPEASRGEHDPPPPHRAGREDGDRRDSTRAGAPRGSR